MDILKSYYSAFNEGNASGMLELLADDIMHEPCQQAPRHGKATFAKFLEHMNNCYKERVIDPVILYSADGKRASAEFMLEGKYLSTDEGLPPAKGQTYRLRVGTFFEIEDGKIKRVTNHYNLEDWIHQVSA